jgi:hypothetical protein
MRCGPAIQASRASSGSTAQTLSSRASSPAAGGPDKALRVWIGTPCCSIRRNNAAHALGSSRDDPTGSGAANPPCISRTPCVISPTHPVFFLPQNLCYFSHSPWLICPTFLIIWTSDSCTIVIKYSVFFTMAPSLLPSTRAVCAWRGLVQEIQHVEYRWWRVGLRTRKGPFLLKRTRTLVFILTGSTLVCVYFFSLKNLFICRFFLHHFPDPTLSRPHLMGKGWGKGGGET